MSTIEKSIDVMVPVSVAYNQWTQFESFPHFMEGVEEVRQISDSLLHWRVNISGHVEEFESEIIEQVPDKAIAWRSRTEPYNSGYVNFFPLSDNSCRITLRMEYETEGLKEKVGDFLGVTTRRVEGDLQRFKEFIESRGAETGGWRGEIHKAA